MTKIRIQSHGNIKFDYYINITGSIQYKICDIGAPYSRTIVMYHLEIHNAGICLATTTLSICFPLGRCFLKK